MILADLDRELAARIAVLVADGTLPPQASAVGPGRTWRTAPDGEPARFATSLAFDVAALAGRDPAPIAASLAASLRRLPWLAAAEPSGGFVTVTVTARALAGAAAEMAAAGRDCARSTILAGTTASRLQPWPDPATAPDWRHAWHAHAAAMTGRLAAAAGARITVIIGPERGTFGAAAEHTAQSAVADAVAWFGAPAVRYRLARTAPGKVSHLGRLLRPGGATTGSLYPVPGSARRRSATPWRVPRRGR